MTHNQPQVTGYPTIFAAIKARIQCGRVRAALAANRELLQLYYSIGLVLRHDWQSEPGVAALLTSLAATSVRPFPT
jgi:hypothetical protein